MYNFEFLNLKKIKIINIIFKIYKKKNIFITNFKLSIIV